MKLDDARHEVREALDEYFRRRDLKPQDRLTTLTVTPRVDQHFSVGLTPHDGHGNFGMEVFVRHENGMAARYADELQQRFGDAVNLTRIRRVEVPSNARMQQAAPTGFGLSAKRRPMQIGASIAHRESMAGSIGLFVEFESGAAKGRRGVLSNSHVLALCGEGRRGDQIFQPGKPDAKPLLQSLQVATLADFTVLTAVGSQEMDAAVALLDDDALSDKANAIPDGLPGCGHCRTALAGVGEPEALARNTVVCKVGRTTAWTSGRVTGIGIDNLPIYVPQLGRNLRFDNIFQIDWTSEADAFSGPGDSGSVVYDPSSMTALGLIFAGGVVERAGKPVGVSYACSLSQALQIFGVRMLT